VLSVELGKARYVRHRILLGKVVGGGPEQ
jgi:hypothetical protein